MSLAQTSQASFSQDWSCLSNLIDQEELPEHEDGVPVFSAVTDSQFILNKDGTRLFPKDSWILRECGKGISVRTDPTTAGFLDKAEYTEIFVSMLEGGRAFVRAFARPALESPACKAVSALKNLDMNKDIEKQMKQIRDMTTEAKRREKKEFKRLQKSCARMNPADRPRLPSQKERHTRRMAIVVEMTTGFTDTVREFIKRDREAMERARSESVSEEPFVPSECKVETSESHVSHAPTSFVASLDESIAS